MKFNKVNRRRFLFGGFLLTPVAVFADAFWLEPDWIKVRRVRLCQGRPSHRLVHFTDLHHKGDRKLTASVVRIINHLSPDFVCFTGDLIEDQKHLPEALELIRGIEAPLYGVPGNHDYWAKTSFEPIKEAFAAGGGAWLMNEHRLIAGGKINLIGSTCHGRDDIKLPVNPDTRNILLIHYPAFSKALTQKFDLILAGHSHGGQVRIPFYGAIMVPWGVEEYEMGLFQTNAGPLYVNPGIGWFPVEVRFNCRPEITLIEI